MGESMSHTDAVIARYALEAPRVVGRVASGFVNENFEVQDVGGARYLLRGYRRLTDQRRLAFQLAFQRHLSASGILTAPVIPTADGEDAVQAGGMFWVLFGWVDGDGFDFQSPGQIQAAARTLAGVHAAGQTFSAGDVPAPAVGQGSYWYRRLETAAEQAGLLTALFPEVELRDQVRFACDWWEAFARAWPAARVESLPRTWLHSDFHGRNVAFAGDDLVCLFDFDDVWFGQRVCDVAQGLFNFGRQSRGIGTPEGRRMRADFACAFLEAYAAELSLTAAELDALPVVVRAVYAPNAFQLQWMKEHGLDYRARFRRDIEITRQIGEEFARIAPALSGVLGRLGQQAG